jgi:hypothetical protein
MKLDHSLGRIFPVIKIDPSAHIAIIKKLQAALAPFYFIREDPEQVQAFIKRNKSQFT